MPEPRCVIALGDGTLARGVLARESEIVGPVDDPVTRAVACFGRGPAQGPAHIKSTEEDECPRRTRSPAGT